jgi:hypothetical protein
VQNKTQLTAKRPLSLTVLSIVAILFGIATINEGGTVLFTQEGKIEAGNFVPFVLWFNFVAGFLYILTGIMLFKLKTGSRLFSIAIAIATIFVFIIFGAHIFNGGAYELRTVVAMTLRSGLWIAISVLALKADNLSK